MGKNSNLSLKLFIINDGIILLMNLIILILLITLIAKEYSYRKTLGLFLFQLIESIIIIALNVIMVIKMLKSKFKGHNNYGMFIRFLIFYLNLCCIILTFQRSDNTNLEDIQTLGKILLFIGLLNNLFIIPSMILSFIVVDTKAFSSKLNKEEFLKEFNKEFNVNSEENVEIFDGENRGTKSSMTELVKK